MHVDNYTPAYAGVFFPINLTLYIYIIIMNNTKNIQFHSFFSIVCKNIFWR